MAEIMRQAHVAKTAVWRWQERFMQEASTARCGTRRAHHASRRWGSVVLDSDVQSRDTFAYFFETFSRVKSACHTVKVFRKEGFASRLEFAIKRRQLSSR